MNKVLSNWFKRYFSHPESVVLLIVIGMVFFALNFLGKELAPVIVSAILSYLLFGLVKKLKKWHVPHIAAVILVFLLFLTVVLVSFFWLLPLLWNEMINLIAEIPVALAKGRDLLLGLHDQYPDLISVAQLDQVATSLTTYIVNFSKEIVSFSLASLAGVFTILVYVVLVPLLVFFFLRDGEAIINWFSAFLPEKRTVLKDVWKEAYDKTSSYIRGKLLELILVAIINISAFWFMELRYAVLLGALVGISVMIPYIGIALVTAPIVIVGLIQWGWSEPFFYLMLIYTVISIIDANVLVPILFSEVMSLHPLAIILAVLIFGGMFGFWGVFFAIPLMALVNIFITMWPKMSENKS